MAVHRYLLDTNILSDLIRNPAGRVTAHLKRLAEDEACTSIVVVSEIRFGLAKRGSKRLAVQAERVLAQLVVLPMDQPVDRHYAEIRADLARIGKPIGSNDLFIAAHARAVGLTLVTDNVEEFSRVPGLAVENWLAAGPS
jgi:tRNA(fMet)-specific endonuclease VapC